jgi:hypothetical protein
VIQNTFLASFAQEEHLLDAIREVQKRNWTVVDVYAPYPVHGLEEVLRWPRSRLPVACFFGGLLGVVLATWFQFWSTATDWPLNVGGRPWNSLPAFVPVIFESMVLLAGFGVVFAWMARCGLYPGKVARLPMTGLTDDRFVLALCGPASPLDGEALRQVLQDCHAINTEERNVEGQP